MRQRRVDFERDVAVRAFALTIERGEQIAGLAYIFDGQLPENLLGIPPGPGQRDERSVVVFRFDDGFVENGWIGSNAADIAAGDHGRQVAIFEQATLDVVVPQGLAEGKGLLNGVGHPSNLPTF